MHDPAGLNKAPATTVRQLDVKVIKAVNLKCADAKTKLNCDKSVTAEITVGTGTDGKTSQTTSRYMAEGKYLWATNKIELKPVQDGSWLTARPDNTFAGVLVGQLTREGEFVEGAYQSNSNCACNAQVADSNGQGDKCAVWTKGESPWCYVDKTCPEAFQTPNDNNANDIKYRSYCDEGECTKSATTHICTACWLGGRRLFNASSPSLDRWKQPTPCLISCLLKQRQQSSWLR